MGGELEGDKCGSAVGNVQPGVMFSRGQCLAGGNVQPGVLFSWGYCSAGNDVRLVPKLAPFLPNRAPFLS